MHCLYQEIQGCQGQMPRPLRCVHCGFVTLATHFPLETYQETYPRECPSPTEKNAGPLPSPGWRLLHYAEAYLKHKASGSQERTQERVLEIFVNHCSPCKRYNDLAGACTICGCYVNPVADGTVANKLLWQTEHCPNQPPKWE